MFFCLLIATILLLPSLLTVELGDTYTIIITFAQLLNKIHVIVFSVVKVCSKAPFTKKTIVCSINW